MRPYFLAPALMLALVAAAPPASAQVTVTPAIGLSKDYRTQTANHWKIGPSLAASVFKRGSKSVSFGVRAAWQRWSADGAGFAKDEAELNGVTTYSLASSSGAQNLIEVVPSIQFPLTRGNGNVALHAQAGLALVFVGASDVTISGSFVSGGSSGTTTVTRSAGSTTGIGAQVGFPISFGRVFQVIPTFSLYHTDDIYTHFGLALGAKLER